MGVCALVGAIAVVGVVEPRAEAVVPTPSSTTSVVTVRTGGDRTEVQGVAPLAGVRLGLFTSATATAPVNETWAICTSDADGDCSFTVPNTGTGGANRSNRYYVKEIAAPAGWFSNAALRTGETSITTSQNTPYAFQTPALLGGQTYSSQSVSGFMLASGNDTDAARSASGGIWQNSRTNPALPAQCGLNVALILDFSGSVAGEEANLKAAADTFVDSLTGTPSRMSLFSFSTLSPAIGGLNFPDLVPVSTTQSAAAFKARYAGWTAEGGTNWDQAFSRVDDANNAADNHFDVAVVITDGNPTYYGNPVQGPGNFTRIREVENGIFSANAIKAAGTRVLAVGVGTGVSDASTALNLQAISGGTKYDAAAGNVETADYFQEPSYEAAGSDSVTSCSPHAPRPCRWSSRSCPPTPRVRTRQVPCRQAPAGPSPRRRSPPSRASTSRSPPQPTAPAP